MQKMLFNLLFIASLSAFLMIGCAQQETSTPEPAQQQPAISDEVLVHTVFFWLHDDVDSEQRQEFREALEQISEIPGILAGYVGIPAVTDREVIDDSYDYSITFVFPDQETEQAYQVHPDHEAFVETWNSIWERVVVYDAVTP